MKKILLAVSFCWLTISYVMSQQNAQQRIEELMQQVPVMGLSVAVVKDNKQVYTQAFGLKNAGTGEALQVNDLFRIASISKSFVATAIMQLVEKKKLSLNDDVSDLVGFSVRNPHFPNTVITLKMLLSHRSSLNDSRGYFTLDSLDPAKSANWQKCYNSYEPGRGYQYCNFNFNTAGTIIERVSGERFDRYIKNHILDPLKIEGGYNVDELDSTMFAAIYEYNTDSAAFIVSPGAYASRKALLAEYRQGYSTPIFSPTGGMKISAPGLARYMIMHMNYGKGHKRIITRKSAQLMQGPVDSLNQYGMALLRTTSLIPGESMVGHTGSAYGLYSIMFFEPEKKFGIVVISNGCDPAYAASFNTVMKKAVNILYEELVKTHL